MKPLVLPSIAILFASLTLFATAASAADYSDLVKEGLGLMHNDSQERKAPEIRPFLDSGYFYVHKGPIIIRSIIQANHGFTGPLNTNDIPTFVDNEFRVGGYGLSGPNLGAYLQPYPSHAWFYTAATARGWMLAKLKATGDKDAFAAPFILTPLFFPLWRPR
jgi:hypothetical protein